MLKCRRVVIGSWWWAPVNTYCWDTGIVFTVIYLSLIKTTTFDSEEWLSQIISNLTNWKEEALKTHGFNGIRTRELRDTGAMLTELWSHTLGTRLHSSIRRASQRHRRSYGFESRWSPDFFRRLLSNSLNWESNAMITLHFHLQPYFKYELSHTYFTSQQLLLELPR